MRRSTRSIGSVLLLVGSLAAGCSSSTGPSVSPSVPGSPAFAESQESSTTPRPSRTAGPGDVVYKGRVEVGDGRRLDVRCVGVGTPTVLLEGGGIDPSLDEFPDAFVKDLGMTTTTCHYSRAGGGGSDALPGKRTMAALVDDAFAMLAALEQEADVKGPYVLAGWSFGGTVALAEALAHPDETVGLVTLDSDFIADFMATCAASGRTPDECQAAYDADIEALSMERELLPQIRPLPDIPLRVITATVLPGCDPSDPDTRHVVVDGKDVVATDCPTLAKLIAQAQLDGWSSVNPEAEQTLVEADHDLLLEQAGDQIADVILDVVQEARATS
jgi:pimeloyl-ACP methyl ester carboxylesterase